MIEKWRRKKGWKLCYVHLGHTSSLQTFFTSFPSSSIPPLNFLSPGGQVCVWSLFLLFILFCPSLPPSLPLSLPLPPSLPTYLPTPLPQFPTLCQQFYHLLHYVCEIFPDHLVSLPDHLFLAVARLLEKGLTRWECMNGVQMVS